MMADKRIRDPVHNLIKFSSSSQEDKVLWSLLQTAPLQRLRRIRQLGFSDFVYPGASHSRFSHSIGAMQMARRMIETLARNDVIKTDDDFPLNRAATLCAALLHDVGHGPFSHVFEGAAAKVGRAFHHEDYTRRMIEETEIHDVLSRMPGLYEGTRALLDEEPGKNVFSQIISSQLDADRLDFLCRDRYFTGIRVGEIDLEWLFDSLLVEHLSPWEEAGEVGPEVPKEATFVVSPKGLGVVEEFLGSYSHMYSSVYFHKATRGIEVLVNEILMGVAKRNDDLASRVGDNAICQFLWNEGNLDDLELYQRLDDTSVLALIKDIAFWEIDGLSELCRRFLERRLLRCFEIPRTGPKEELPRVKTGAFRSALQKDGIQSRNDLIPPKGYKQFALMSDDFLKNILAYRKTDGEPRPIAELCPAVQHFTDRPAMRFYFFSEDDKKKAEAIWKGL